MTDTAIRATSGRLEDVDAADREAFDAFARARTPALLRFAYVLTGDRDKAADLVQDALERTVAAWPRVVRKDDPEGYVRRAIVHRNVSVWRRMRREHVTDQVPDTAYVPSDPHDAALWSTLGELPPRMRAVLVLRFYEDLGEAQTAEVLGCSVGTVKSTTSRALVRLREKLAAQQQEGTWST
ncbi:MAG TPA: SigE family RNA polymerase sigma factor [Actinomycetes bacterium]|nr:SigE family RNA polymerase sigma factor [Actinomycetes bacterium]